VIVAKRRPADDEDILRELAAIPAAREFVEKLRARHRRGRRPMPEANFRKLELWWKCFCRLNSGLSLEHAAQKFLRVRGKEIEKLLKLKRRTPGALRNAVARGARETARVNALRRGAWRIGPSSLGDFMHGRHYRVFSDPNEHLLLSAAMRRALLGEN
jgi:hypothetical protein